MDWVDSSLCIPEVVLGVLWDEAEDENGRREGFGMRGEGEGDRGRKWKVEKWHKVEENDLWEREWGYLVDLSMSG